MGVVPWRRRRTGIDLRRGRRWELVQAHAWGLGVNLEFLPTYWPNLNLIERYWRRVKILGTLSATNTRMDMHNFWWGFICLLLERIGSDMVHDDMPMMNCGMGRGAELRSAGVRTLGLCALLITVLAAGCARSGKQGGRSDAFTGIRPPKPPAFLNGPMALLLTNTGGFSARAVLESGAPASGVELAAGELLGQGGKLLFAPGTGKATAKRARAEDFAFIWDVAANRGYALNDPLQGYAPISYGRLFTNLATSATLNPAATENVAGHPCQQTEVTVAADDGSASVFRVWRAMDLKGLAVRISGASDGTPVTLTLSKVKLEPMPNELFQPPAGFTKYASAEAMVNELMSRQLNLKQRPSYQMENLEPPSGQAVRPPVRSY
jgi:hypothetical protein